MTDQQSQSYVTRSEKWVHEGAIKAQEKITRWAIQEEKKAYAEIYERMHEEYNKSWFKFLNRGLLVKPDDYQEMREWADENYWYPPISEAADLAESRAAKARAIQNATDPNLGDDHKCSLSFDDSRFLERWLNWEGE